MPGVMSPITHLPGFAPSKVSGIRLDLHGNGGGAQRADDRCVSGRGISNIMTTAVLLAVQASSQAADLVVTISLSLFLYAAGR